MFSLNTNPITKGFFTSEFVLTVLGGLGVAHIASQVFTVPMTDALSHLFAVALAGIAAIGSILWLSYNWMVKRSDLKMLMIEKGIIPDDAPVPDPTPVADVPAA